MDAAIARHEHAGAGPGTTVKRIAERPRTGRPCAALDEVLGCEMHERQPWRHPSGGTRPAEPKNKGCGYALGGKTHTAKVLGSAIIH